MITLSRHKQKLFATWYKINEYVVTLQSETIVKVIAIFQKLNHANIIKMIARQLFTMMYCKILVINLCFPSRDTCNIIKKLGRHNKNKFVHVYLPVKA